MPATSQLSQAEHGYLVWAIHRHRGFQPGVWAHAAQTPGAIAAIVACAHAQATMGCRTKRSGHKHRGTRSRGNGSPAGASRAISGASSSAEIRSPPVLETYCSLRSGSTSWRRYGLAPP